MSHDSARVLVPPPILYAGGLSVMLLFGWIRPLPMAAHGLSPWPGMALAVLSFAIGMSGRRALRAAGTTIDPRRATSTIVASGPFRWSRNPIYVALACLFLGLTLALNSGWGLLELPVILVVMHVGVVRREERYLTAKFGDAYRDYCAAVRRYL